MRRIGEGGTVACAAAGQAGAGYHHQLLQYRCQIRRMFGNRAISDDLDLGHLRQQRRQYLYRRRCPIGQTDDIRRVVAQIPRQQFQIPGHLRRQQIKKRLQVVRAIRSQTRAIGGVAPRQWGGGFLYPGQGVDRDSPKLDLAGEDVLIGHRRFGSGQDPDATGQRDPLCPAAMCLMALQGSRKPEPVARGRAFGDLIAGDDDPIQIFGRGPAGVSCCKAPDRGGDDPGRCRICIRRDPVICGQPAVQAGGELRVLCPENGAMTLIHRCGGGRISPRQMPMCQKHRKPAVIGSRPGQADELPGHGGTGTTGADQRRLHDAISHIIAPGSEQPIDPMKKCRRVVGKPPVDAAPCIQHVFPRRGAADQFGNTDLRQRVIRQKAQGLFGVRQISRRNIRRDGAGPQARNQTQDFIPFRTARPGRYSRWIRQQRRNMVHPGSGKCKFRCQRRLGAMERPGSGRGRLCRCRPWRGHLRQMRVKMGRHPLFGQKPFELWHIAAEHRCARRDCARLPECIDIAAGIEDRQLQAAQHAGDQTDEITPCPQRRSIITIGREVADKKTVRQPGCNRGKVIFERSLGRHMRAHVTQQSGVILGQRVKAGQVAEVLRNLAACPIGQKPKIGGCLSRVGQQRCKPPPDLGPAEKAAVAAQAFGPGYLDNAGNRRCRAGGGTGCSGKGGVSNLACLCCRDGRRVFHEMQKPKRRKFGDVQRRIAHARRAENGQRRGILGPRMRLPRLLCRDPKLITHNNLPRTRPRFVFCGVAVLDPMKMGRRLINVKNL